MAHAKLTLMVQNEFKADPLTETIIVQLDNNYAE